jgi:hypothetical protein
MLNAPEPHQLLPAQQLLSTRLAARIGGWQPAAGLKAVAAAGERGIS